MIVTGAKGEPVARTSADVIEDRAALLRELFPECLTEGQIDFDKLRAALGDEVDARPERYSFAWAGKRECIRLLQKPSRATLIPRPGESVDFEQTQHVFIEGDNLETLKLLYKAYFGRVKMIYIDPPYNTGNDFIYPDNFADPLDTYLRLTGQKDANGNLLTSNPETSGRYHSAWLSMMYPRLFLARQLLTEDGVIFVSIDDHEAHHLRLLLNEVFGEENFVGQIVAQVNPRGRHLDRFIAKTHEYLVVYARDAGQQAMHQLEKDEQMTREYNKSDARGSYRELELRNRNPAFNRRTRPNLYYPIFINHATDEVSLSEDADHAVAVYPKNSSGEDSCWTWGKDKAAKDAHLLLGRRTADGYWRIFRKDYLIRDDGTTATTLPKALWLDKEVNYDYGKKAIQDIFEGKTVFDFPKPPALVRRMLQIGMREDDIVLDFFAGSCTTAQAVLELNREDGGARRFIMVQLPEPTDNQQFETIADIGKERIRRVIQRMKAADEGKLGLQSGEAPEDLGFRVFKLAESNYQQWDDAARQEPAAYEEQMALFNDPLLPGWQVESVIWEVAVKEGYALDARIERMPAISANTVYRVTDAGRGQTFHICLDDAVTLDTLRALSLGRDDVFVCRDAALDDEKAANLALQCRLKTI